MWHCPQAHFRGKGRASHLIVGAPESSGLPESKGRGVKLAFARHTRNALTVCSQRGMAEGGKVLSACL